MSGWLYEDKKHSVECQCDQCEGHTYIERHVPDDCLFDEDTKRFHGGARQERWRTW